MMGGYRNEIEQFIYEICYHPMWNQVAPYIYWRPYSLDLSFLKIKYPESAILEDMILEFASNIRINDDSLLFDANVSCSIALSGENDRSSYSLDIN